MKEILLFRHESWIEAPHLTDLFSALAIPYRLIKIDENDAIPANVTDDMGGLVFYGGTMSVNDPLPWIDAELRLIKQAHQRKMPILGHCLGSQLISKALGGKVTPMAEKEIGWHPIRFLDNETALEWQGSIPNHTKIMLWHHDEFTLPQGATPLYTTSNCKNQAFVKDNILATVAHIEVSAPMLETWLEIYGHDIEPNGGAVQTIAQIKDDMENKMAQMYVLSDIFYIKWLKLVYSQNTHPDIYEKLQSCLQSGSCLCGGVRFFLKYPRDVVNCHCLACRKFHGNYAAFTKVALTDIYIAGENQLNWFQLQQGQAARGFCKTCGASLFWKPDNNDGLCVSAGTLDIPTHLKATTNIYTDAASDFYAMDDDLRSYSATMQSAVS